MPKLTSFIFVLAIAAPPAAADSMLRIELPSGVEWTQVTDSSDESRYLREWVPAGTEPATAYWIIVEQRLTLPRRSNGRAYTRSIMEAARGACTNVLYNGPDEIRVGDHDTYVVRTMCAQRRGSELGAFIDQRIMVDGDVAYIVTSELRTAATRRAGALEFGPDTDRNEIMQFMTRTQQSADFVRSGVTVEE